MFERTFNFASRKCFCEGAVGKFNTKYFPPEGTFW